MSHHTVFIAAALQTAEEFGVPAEKLQAFEASLLEKMKAMPEVRFVYTADFLRSFRGQCTEAPSDLAKGEWTLSEKDRARTRTAYAPGQGRGRGRSPNKRRGRKPTPKSPPPPMERSENAWMPSHIRKSDDPNVALMKSINGDLNKLTETNYESISERVLENLTEGVLEKFVAIMFDKAVWDAKYRDMYARLCVQIQKKFSDFRRPLLSQCQAEFNKPQPPPLEITGDPKSPENQEEAAEYEYEMVKWKKRRLGNIHFIVELLKVRIVHPKVLLACLYGLLKHEPTEPLSDNVFHAAELLTIARGNVQPGMMIPAAKRLNEFLVAGKLGTREKFKVQDTLELYGAKV